MLKFLDFKERMNFCRVCKLWKNVIEKTKIESLVFMHQFTNISMESAAKICPLVIAIDMQKNFPNKFKQGRMFPKFTGLKLLLLENCTEYDNHNLVSVSKLICKSAKTLKLISVDNVEHCASFVMGTIFPKLTSFLLQTELNDTGIEFLKQFLNLIPEMFPNLYLFQFTFLLQQRAQNQEIWDFLNWVQNLKFSSLPKLQIGLNHFAAQ